MSPSRGAHGYVKVNLPGILLFDSATGITSMKTYLSAALVVLLAATMGSAQSESRFTYSQPAIPSRADLERLNLRQAWHTYLPVDGTRDGVFRVHIHAKLLLFHTRSGSAFYAPC